MNGTDILVRRRSYRPRISQVVLAPRIGMSVAELIALENNRVSLSEERLSQILETIDAIAVEQQESKCATQAGVAA